MVLRLVPMVLPTKSMAIASLLVMNMLCQPGTARGLLLLADGPCWGTVCIIMLLLAESMAIASLPVVK